MNSVYKYLELSNEKIPLQTRIILNEYMLMLKFTRSEATINKYHWILEKFCSECSISLKNLTLKDVLEWLNDSSVGKKPRTINLYLSCLSSFFKFCQEEGYMGSIVIKNRWRTKVPQSFHSYLNEQEYKRVKLAAKSFSLRDQALILFLFSTGCKSSELADLNIQDVDLERRIATLGNRRMRYAHFSEECALVLKEYLRMRTVDKTKAVFINREGNRLLQKGIYEIIKRLGEKAGLQQSLHPRCIRHTVATRMLANGMNIEFVAYQIGHVDINTTFKYVTTINPSCKPVYFDSSFLVKIEQ
jgi:integrase/recombinase XerD